MSDSVPESQSSEQLPSSHDAVAPAAPEGPLKAGHGEGRKSLPLPKRGMSTGGAAARSSQNIAEAMNILNFIDRTEETVPELRDKAGR